MIRPQARFPVEVIACTSRIIRVRLGSDAPGPASYLPARDWPDGPHDTDATRLVTDAVTVTTASDGITFTDCHGTARLRLALDQTHLLPRPLVRLQIFGEQHFYGLGEGGAQFDRLGTVRRFWNFQVNRGQGADIAIPLLLSQVGYGVFFDCSAAATLEPGDAGDGAWLEYRADAGPLDLYFIAGPTLRDVLGQVAELLGRATMPPRWALGYLQSSRHFADTAELRNLATQFRTRRLPCDALIFLSSYNTAKGWNRGVGHLEFEPDLFAEADALLRTFRDRHFQVITHEYPVLHAHSPLHPEAEANGHLLDTAYPRLLPDQPLAPVYKDGQRLIDFSREDTRAWWWQAHQSLCESGVAGWWLDGGEGPPANAALHAGSARLLHNRYDLLRQQAFAEGEARDRPDTRPFLLCRSGGPGMQRFGAIPWSGDINATFASLELQIRTGLNVGMSGVPHWGTDTGGFYRVGDNDPELFVRWFQFSAFCSIFRGHGHVWRQHLPWSNGQQIEDICRTYMELRSRLMPYTYTLAWQARMSGLPLMRPLVLNYPDDPNTWDLGTQYLWGDDILVAPVTRKGATQWTIYLPKGTWYDFWNNEAHEGPGGITIAAPLEKLPLFVRAGAIIPLGPVKQYDADPVADQVTLLIYPHGDTSFDLYDDDGHSNAYLDQKYLTTVLSCRADAKGCVIRITPQPGDTAQADPGRSYLLKVFAQRSPRHVALEDALGVVRDAAFWYDGAFLFVPTVGAQSNVRITW